MFDRVSSNLLTVLLGAVIIIALFLGAALVTLWFRMTALQAREAAARARAANALAQVDAAIANFESTQSTQATSKIAPLRILSWNVESGGNDPAVIAKELVDLGRFDVLALQEVHGDNIGRYGDAVRQGLGESYRYFPSHTGRSDRLLIIFDSDRLRLNETRELFQYGDHQFNDWRHRSPLAAEFTDQQSGQVLLLVTVHLARGNARLRQAQASGLRKWARDQKLPVIAVGDFNFDYDFPTASGNQAFENLLQDGVWKWINPDPLVDTNWSDSDRDGEENYPDSMLDFAFVAGPARDWDSVAEVVVRPDDFPDTDATSDHRPVILEVLPR